MSLRLAVFLLLTITVPLSCQDKGYSTHSEYSTDSVGNTVLRTGLKYQMISNKSTFGFKDSLGNIVIPLEKYSFLNSIDEQGMILAKKGGKEGYIDINDNIIIPFIYDDLGVFSECVDLAPAVINKKQGFINRKGKVIIPFEYNYTSYVRYFYEPGIAVVSKNWKFGVIDAENKAIIPFIYSDIDFYWRSDVIIAWQGEKWACFSTSGEQLSDFNDYKIVRNSLLGYRPKDSKNLPFLVTSKETKGFAYLDKYHNFVVPFGVYDYADIFGLGRKAIVANKKKYGIIDDHGKLVLPLDYDLVERPSLYSKYANIYIATNKDGVTLFDEDLNVNPTKKIVSYWDNEGSIIVTDRKNKKGLVNYDGVQTIPFLYDTLYHAWTVPRIAGFVAKKDNLYGFITSNNEIIHPFKYNYIYALDGNVVCVDQNNKVGIYNNDGSIMIPFEYDAIHKTHYEYYITEVEFPTTKDLYIVEKEGKLGTIDDKNNVIIPIEYDGLSGWVENGPNAHFVKNDGKYGIISYKGKIIIPIEYDYIGMPQNGIVCVRKNGKYGVLSWKNKVILPFVFDKAFLDIPMIYFENKKPISKIVVQQQNNWMYYDLTGKILQANVPLKEINEKYDYIFEWLESKYLDTIIDLKQKGSLRNEY